MPDDSPEFARGVATEEAVEQARQVLGRNAGPRIRHLISVGLFRALGGGWNVNGAATQTAPT